MPSQISNNSTFSYILELKRSAFVTFHSSTVIAMWPKTIFQRTLLIPCEMLLYSILSRFPIEPPRPRAKNNIIWVSIFKLSHNVISCSTHRFFSLFTSLLLLWQLYTNKKYTYIFRVATLFYWSIFEGYLGEFLWSFRFKVNFGVSGRSGAVQILLKI